jgi:glycosyltransferase involved in cell wall biosynthesis
LLSRSGSAEELAMNSGSALFRPRDAYDLAHKLEQIISRSDWREMMSEQGRKFVVENHSLTKRLEMTLEIYLRCLRRRIS